MSQCDGVAGSPAWDNDAQDPARPGRKGGAGAVTPGQTGAPDAARYQEVDPARLDPEARRVFDAIAGPRGHVPAPHQILMAHPMLAELLGRVGEEIRFHGRLPADARELAILTVARTASARYEWVMHEPIARRAGVTDAALQTILTTGPLDDLSERDRIVVAVARAVLSGGPVHVDNELFTAAEATLGRATLVELIVLCGYYLTLAMALSAFEAPLPDGMSAPF